MPLRRVLLVLLIVLLGPLHAGGYDDDTLRIFAKIAPRIVLMSSVRDRVKEGIELCIVSEVMDADNAELFGRMILESYPNGMTKYPVVITQAHYRTLGACRDAHLMFLFDTDGEGFDAAIAYADAHRLLDVVYDERLLERGADVSLHLGRKVLPILNLQTLQRKGITMDNPLIRISKIHGEAAQ